MITVAWLLGWDVVNKDATGKETKRRGSKRKRMVSEIERQKQVQKEMYYSMFYRSSWIKK